MFGQDQAGEQVRPNPFAFASDTSFRFVLLVVGILGVIPEIWGRLWLTLNIDRARELARYCKAAFPDRPFVFDRSRAADDYVYWSKTYTEYYDYRYAAVRCFEPVFGRSSVVAELVGVGLVLIVAIAIYILLPRWMTRRLHLAPLPRDGLDAVWTELNRLRVETGVGRVSYVVNPLNTNVGAVAFGRFGRRYVALDAGLVKCAKDDPLVFRAVLRHEFAHLRNRDVDKSYFTVAVWRAFVVVGLIPFVGLQAFDAIANTSIDYRDVWGYGWRIAALTTLVILVRNAILRARESAADVRAAVWDRADGGLLRVLSAPERTRQGLRWPALLRRHPTTSARCAAVKNPQAMLGVGFWDSFAAGLVATIGFNAVAGMANSFGLSGTGALWTGVIYGPLVAGVVGLAIWRAAYADYVVGRRQALRPNRVGLGLGIGLTVGPLFSLSDNFNGKFDNVLGERAPMSAIVSAAVVVVCGAWVLVRWLAAVSSVWMPGVTRRVSPRVATIVAAAVFALVCGQALNIIFGIRNTTIVNSGPGLPHTVLNAIFVPAMPSDEDSPWAVAMSLVVLTVLWAYPLIGARRPVVGALSPWVTLDGNHPTLACDLRPLRIRTAITVGFIAAGLGLAAMVMYRQQALATVPSGVALAEDVSADINGRILGLAWIVELVAGIVTAAIVPRLRVSHAVCAASAAGVIAGTGSVLLALGNVSSSWDLADLVRAPGIILFPGLLAALVSALVVAGIAAAGRAVLRGGPQSKTRRAGLAPAGQQFAPQSDTADASGRRVVGR